MTSIAVEKLAVSLKNLLKKIEDHCCTLSKTKQPFGVCIVTPKSPYIHSPTKEIRDEIENRARDHFKAQQLVGIYLRYFNPPLMPFPEDNISQELISADDYRLTCEIPQFDKKWLQTVFARNLIFCPLDPELYDYLDWFEIQEEAIRLVPNIDQTVKELDIMASTERALQLPAAEIFISFIYDYGETDPHQEMSQEDGRKWRAKEIDWKERYMLVSPIIKPAKTVHDLYRIARQKATTSRNPLLKALFWAFVEHIENNLIVKTLLPDEIKNRLLNKLRQTKKRATKGKYVAKKRPAISISDIECGQMLHVMICDYLSNKDKAIAEALFFVWIAQHGAFSDHHLTVDGILSIKMSDIKVDDLTIQVQAKEIDTEEGFIGILSDWIGTANRKNQRKFFQNITYDSLEDIISNYSIMLYGNEGRLLPRDFLEKVHVVPEVRMALDLRRKIIEQEKLVKDSPYRIKSEKIKKDIKESMKKNKLKVSPEV